MLGNPNPTPDPNPNPTPNPNPNPDQVLGFGRSTPLPKPDSKSVTADGAAEVDAKGTRATAADRRETPRHAARLLAHCYS